MIIGAELLGGRVNPCRGGSCPGWDCSQSRYQFPEKRSDWHGIVAPPVFHVAAPPRDENVIARLELPVNGASGIPALARSRRNAFLVEFRESAGFGLRIIRVEVKRGWARNPKVHFEVGQLHIVWRIILVAARRVGSTKCLAPISKCLSLRYPWFGIRRGTRRSRRTYAWGGTYTR